MIDSKLFIGVIEDINDPLERNRVRVRVYGKHTEDTALIPTDTLPWSTIMMPVTEASVPGVGSTIGLVQGSWVVGFFSDPDESEAVIIGSLPTESTRVEGNVGFKDPDNVHPRRNGIDTPFIATSDYEEDSTFRIKESNHVTSIPTATPPLLTTLEPVAGIPPEYDPVSYDLPDPVETVQPVYPHNHVKKSESGHTHEVDDTAGFERIATTHTSGSSNEILADGSTITVVRGKGYRVVFEDDNVYIKGACNLTIDGDTRTLIRGNYHLEVEGDYTQNIHGSKKTHCLASLTEIEQNCATNIGENELINIGKSRTDTVGENITLKVGNDSTTLTGGTTSITAGGSLNFSAQKTSKFSTAQKMHLNASLITAPSDIHGGAAAISLLKHVHPYQDSTGTDPAAGVTQKPFEGAPNV